MKCKFCMSYVPEDKDFCIKNSVYQGKTETLAEYYCRFDGHLLRAVKIFEVDDGECERPNRLGGKADCIFETILDYPGLGTFYFLLDPFTFQK